MGGVFQEIDEKFVKGKTMEDAFFKYWFDGLDKALEQIDSDNRTKIFKECGKACSESYTKQVFQEEYEKSTDFHDFLNRLTGRFKVMQYEVLEENRTYLFIYTVCACDLIRMGYMHSDKLCECSKFSLQENLEAILGEGSVRVQLLEAILKGDKHCKLLVELGRYDREG